MILHYKEQGNGQTIVLLHGMAGSLRYWKPFIPYIGKGYRVIAIDLLGYGHSQMPKDVVYDYATHVKSILQTLEHIGISQPFILVGHSMGALIALRMASMYPNQVKKAVLIAMPIYRDETSAHDAITGGSKLKELAYYGLTSRLLCNAWCHYLRPISSRLAPKYLPHLHQDAARDSVLHTWQSYAQSLHNVIELQNVRHDIIATSVPITLVYGDRDLPHDLNKIEQLTRGKHVRICIFSGTHQIIHEHPVEVASIVMSEV